MSKLRDALVTTESTGPKSAFEECCAKSRSAPNITSKQMNRETVLAVAEASLSRPTGTPNTSALARDEFIEQEKAKLRASLIEPLQVQAYPSEWAIEQCGLADKTYDSVAVASEGDVGTYWLLLDPATNNFYKAWRGVEPGEKMYLLGYHSDDALTEWRG